MVCNNSYLLLWRHKKIFSIIILISFNSHRFPCIIFNYSNLLEAWPTLLGSHMSYTTSCDPQTCFHSPAFFHRPTTTHSTLFCVRAMQRREWRKGSQDGHQRWAPAHLQRASALSPLQPINCHLLPPTSSHKHSRKPGKFQFLEKELL